MKLKTKAYYDIIAPTSMGLRMSPLTNQETIQTSSHYRMQATSAESNVLTLGAALGLKTKVLTAFVEDSLLSQYIKQDLNRRNIDFDDNDKTQNGPWGVRHQINFVDPGYGLRGPRVHNDRAGEVGKMLSIKDIDLADLFINKGVKILHISGLFLALSKTSAEVCLTLAKWAQKHDTKVCFDVNYRASFWANRPNELRQIFKEIIALSDILIGGVYDLEQTINLKQEDSSIDAVKHYQLTVKKMQEQYPNIELFASTTRIVDNSNSHQLGAMIDLDDIFEMITPKPISVFDRIGGGDAFVGGLLYGLLTDMSVKEMLCFGWASGVFAVSIPDDFVMPHNTTQLWDIWHQNVRVKR
ncbi:MAG: sugar kinase [Candidatus Izimaplasma sp.]|nr:sugar kinase [Candidatus Izimaplasma bacterium]